VWCPILRLHGHREPSSEKLTAGLTGPAPERSGGRSADDAFIAIISRFSVCASDLRPYILNARCRSRPRPVCPPMRPPIWFDHAYATRRAWKIEDEFLFGT